MQKQEDERKEKGPEKMDAVNEEYGYSPDIGDEYKQLIKEGDRRRKRTEKGRRKRYEQGYRNTLIKLMLTSGGIAYSGLKFLPGNKRMYLRKLKILEREGVVEILRRNKKEIARLVNFEENYEKYISHMPIGYYGYYLQHGKPTHKNLGSKEKNCTRSDRGIKHCEIYEMMYGTGIIKILPEDKTELSSTESLRSNSICYYTINEMRECQHKPDGSDLEQILVLCTSAGEAADNAPHQSHILLNKLCSRSLIPMVCSVNQTHHIIHRDYLLFCISKSFPHGHCSSQPRL